MFADVKTAFEATRGEFPKRCTEEFLVAVATAAAEYGIGMWMGSSAKGAGRPPTIGPDNKIWIMWNNFLENTTVASASRKAKIPELEDADDTSDEGAASAPAAAAAAAAAPRPKVIMPIRKFNPVKQVKSKKAVQKVSHEVKNKITMHFQKVLYYLDMAGSKVPKSVAMEVASQLNFDEVLA